MSQFLLDAPKIKEFSFHGDILEGEMVSVTCLAATKIKPISYEWSKNGNTLEASLSNVRMTTTDELSVLILDPVSLDDSGNYTCKATNSAGYDKHTTSLNVKGEIFINLFMFSFV